MSIKITLQDAYKTYTDDQDKIMSPEKTIATYRDRLQNAQLDILDHTERIDNGRLDIPVFFSVCGQDARDIIGNKKQMGKGASPAQAEASAIMELAERFSFFSFCKNPANFTIDTYANLKQDALAFEAIAKSVHDTSGDLDAARRIFETIPMRWTRAWNLTAGRDVMVPFDWFYAINEFNGPSAGNCQEEALSQGICEIVERHVSSIISRQKLMLPGIRPESTTDAMAQNTLGKYRRNGIQLHVQDFSLDTGIPTVGVLAYDPSTFPQSSELVWTAGTTPNPDKAFSRALTEVAQLAGDFNSCANYVASGLPKYTRLDQAAFLMNPETMVDLQTLPDLSNDNIRVEVENLVNTLGHRGLEALVINTMHPLLGIPAFYTIVPGTHFRERAEGTSVGMFSAKLVVENQPPEMALNELEKFDALLPGRAPPTKVAWLRVPAFPRGTLAPSFGMFAAWGVTGVTITSVPLALAQAGYPRMGPLAVCFMILTGTAVQQAIGRMPARRLSLLGLPLLVAGAGLVILGTLGASLPLLLAGGALVGSAAYGFLFVGALAAAAEAAAGEDRARAAAGVFLIAHAGFCVPPLLAGLAVDAFGAGPALAGFWAGWWRCVRGAGLGAAAGGGGGQKVGGGEPPPSPLPSLAPGADPGGGAPR